MVKHSLPYRSRSLIFGYKSNNTPASPSTGSPTSPTYHVGRSFFSPLSSSSSSPAPVVNTPSPDLDTDPFRSSLDSISIPYTRSNRHQPAQSHGQSESAFSVSDEVSVDQNTTRLVRGTATTPKITLASPSTTSFQFLDHPPQSRDKSGLDPTAAKKIAKSILKNKAREAELVVNQEREQFSDFGHSYSTPATPAKEARRTVSTSDLRERRSSQHPLSMRTLRRQPSLVDLHTHRTKADLVNGTTGLQESHHVPLATRHSNDFSKVCHPKRQEQAWKNILARRESEAWRKLVDSKDRDSVPSIIDDVISPRTRTFPAAGDDESAPMPPRPSRRPSHPFLSSFDPQSQPDLPTIQVAPGQSYRQVKTGERITVEHSRASSPSFADPADLASHYASPTYTYAHMDQSFSASSGMSRCGTLGSRLDSLPTSVAMERDIPVQRPGTVSYANGRLEARADALRRLSGVPARFAQQTNGEDDDRIEMLRRAASFKKESKKEKTRPRAYSLSAKSARESGISSPIPIGVPLPDRRRTIENLRGIYLGELSIDLGGRYVNDRSPTAASTETSIYPASSQSSRRISKANIVGKPLHPDLSGSEISLLAPSSVGLGFSPIGTPVSLPESLRAEAIDLTGNYGIPIDEVMKKDKEVKRSSSRPRIKLDSPPPPLPNSEIAYLLEDEEHCLRTKTSPDTSNVSRRSLLLAQNTFYIPPVVAPPSLRSSKSLSNLRPSPSTPTIPATAPPPIQSKTAYHKRSHSRKATGAFGICSPPDAIDPLPLNSTEGISPISLPGLERKRSSPFINASASIRSMFKGSTIARSLSKTFDRQPERQGDRSNARTEPDVSMRDKGVLSIAEEKEWREGLLKEAVTVSLGGSGRTRGREKRTGNPKSRLAIPKELLEAPVIKEIPAGLAQVECGEEGLVLEHRVLEHGWSRPSSPNEFDNQPTETVSRPASAKESRSRTNSVKRRSRSATITAPRLGSTARPAESILPPLPFETDTAFHQAFDAEIKSGRDCTTPTTLQRRVTPYYSEPRSPATSTLQRRLTPYYNRTRQLEVDITPPADSISLAPSTRSFRSLGLRLRSRSSRTALAEPISSSSHTTPSPMPILDALSSQTRALTAQGQGESDRVRKILEWREEVDENGELARLEERMIKHVEREREALRDMGRRDGVSTDAAH